MGRTRRADTAAGICGWLGGRWASGRCDGAAAVGLAAGFCGTGGAGRDGGRGAGRVVGRALAVGGCAYFWVFRDVRFSRRCFFVVFVVCLCFRRLPVIAKHI